MVEAPFISIFAIQIFDELDFHETISKSLGAGISGAPV